MNKPKLEEFMVFENKNGEMGVIIKRDSDNCPWWKCYKDEDSGQIFDEHDERYNYIKKLYKVKYGYDKRFNALKFMKTGSIYNYNCVYEYVEPVEETKSVNITINLTLNDTKNLKDIANEIKAVLEKSNFTNP